MSFLEVKGLTKKFVGLVAIKRLSFHVAKAELLGLVGPNGAGKTTLFNLITGFLTPSEGDIIFKGQGIKGLKPHRIVGAGITKTFQIPKPFHSLSCFENVVVSLLPNYKPPQKRKHEIEARSQEILEIVGLHEKRDMLPGSLTQGDLKVLEVARALATGPELLLLDEPFAGLSIREIEQLSSIIQDLHQKGLTIIIVEHKMRELMKLVKRILVLHFGEKIADGSPETISRDEKVIEAYLGSRDLTRVAS